MPCPRGSIYFKQFPWKVPVADGYLTVWIQRGMAAGVQLNLAGRVSGAAYCSSQWWPVLYSLCRLQTGSAYLSLMI
jgi:hypothetical protein